MLLRRSPLLWLVVYAALRTYPILTQEITPPTNGLSNSSPVIESREGSGDALESESNTLPTPSPTNSENDLSGETSNNESVTLKPTTPPANSLDNDETIVVSLPTPNVTTSAPTEGPNNHSNSGPFKPSVSLGGAGVSHLPPVLHLPSNNSTEGPITTPGETEVASPSPSPANNILSEPTPTGSQNISTHMDNFYLYTCSADTYILQLSSYSSLAAILGAFILMCAFVIFLMSMCFKKFARSMVA